MKAFFQCTRICNDDIYQSIISNFRDSNKENDVRCIKNQLYHTTTIVDEYGR